MFCITAVFSYLKKNVLLLNLTLNLKQQVGLQLMKLFHSHFHHCNKKPLQEHCINFFLEA